MRYTKPPVSFSDQIQKLKDRGLVIPDEAAAYRSYRISAIIGCVLIPIPIRTTIIQTIYLWVKCRWRILWRFILLTEN